MHSTRALRILAIALLSLTNAACMPSVRGGPDRIFTVGKETELIREQFGPPDFNAYFSFSESMRVSYRNNYVLARMYAMDLQYSTFEADLTRERQNVGFWSATSNIALTGTASLISSVATKNILAAVAAGLTGARAAYDDDVLLNKTVQLLQSQMRANRARVASVIISKLSQSSGAYPLGLALADLEEYYRAGTITGAMIDVANTVGSIAIAEQATREVKLVTATSPQERSFVTLTSFLFPKGRTGGIDQQRFDHLRSLLTNSDVPLAVLLNDARYSTVRLRLTRCAEGFLAGSPCAPKSISNN